MTGSNILHNTGNGQEEVKYLSLGPFNDVTVESE